MSQEVGIVWLCVDSIFIVTKCIFVLAHGVMSTTETILNAPVLLKGRRIGFFLICFMLLGLLEVLYSLFVTLLSMSALAKSVEGLRQLSESSDALLLVCELFIDVNSLQEVLNSHLVVTHVVVNDASCNVNSRVILDLDEDLRKALQGLSGLISPVVHQAKMEPRADEVLLQSQGLNVRLDSLLIQVVWVSLVVFVKLHHFLLVVLDLLRLSLIGETLRVPQLGVVGRNLNSLLIVSMGIVKLWWIHVQVDVASVEVDRRVVLIQSQGFVKVSLSTLQVVGVVESQATIVVVDGRLLNLNGLFIVCEGFVELLGLKLRQSKVVEGRCFV